MEANHAQADENHEYRGTVCLIWRSQLKRQAREDVQNGAIYVNGDRIQDLTMS